MDSLTAPATPATTVTPATSRETVPTAREAPVTLLARARQLAWLAIVIADGGFLVWGAEAALAPGCPGACLTTGYETFTRQSWSDLVAMSAATSVFLTMVFRVYGAYNVAFGVVATAIAGTAFRRNERWAWWALLIGNTIALPSAMTYDRLVGYIGPFEALEYVGLVMIYTALAVTASAQTAPAGRLDVSRN